ncbi:MAG: phosphatidylserine decarboxylase [Bdellovibrionia bacterium]
MEKSIVVWNRQQGKEEVEQVFGDAWVQFLYGTSVGKKLADQFLSRSWVSQVVGRYQDTRFSARKVDAFVKKFQIPMEEFEPGPFLNFNEFFIRQFKPGQREFVSADNEMGAFAEARYLAYEKVGLEERFPVKGKWLSASALLGDESNAKVFEGGPMLLARLCPTDYHRFHFPDSGEVLKQYTISGKLHSVNPLALQAKPEILITNERQVSLLKTEHFGNLAFVEVGALCVGRIVQTFGSNSGAVSAQAAFKKGQEKGYFLFGGSTVIVLGEPGLWRPDADLLEQTQKGRESRVRLGERVAVAPLRGVD